jgi:hypothetical protein
MRFEVFTAVTIMMMFFWVWAPLGLASLPATLYNPSDSHFSPEDGDSTLL